VFRPVYGTLLYSVASKGGVVYSKVKGCFDTVVVRYSKERISHITITLNQSTILVLERTSDIYSKEKLEIVLAIGLIFCPFHTRYLVSTIYQLGQST
jgi:hypothetical protein